MEQTKLKTLELNAAKARLYGVQMVHDAASGHPGGSMSCMDVLTYLYFAEMRVDPKNPHDPGRDRFVMSKGHCSPAMYPVLALRGFFPAEFIDLEADAAHARIDGDMDAQGLAQAPGFLGEEFGVLQVEDSRFDVIRQEFFCPPGVGMAEDEDFVVDMRIAAELDGFVQAGHGKAVGAVFGKGLGQFDTAVAVGIGLDDGGDFDIRPDVLAYLAHIMSRCVEVDLGPDGTACKIHGTFICIHHYLAFPFGMLLYFIIIAQPL